MASLKIPTASSFGYAEDDPNREVRISAEFNRAMRAMNRYIAKYHGNMSKEFQKMDKDGNGALDVEELKNGFEQLGVHINREIWQVIVDTIDQDKSGLVELAELIDTMYRWGKGGWKAVEAKHGAGQVKESMSSKLAQYDAMQHHTSWDQRDFEVKTRVQRNPASVWCLLAQKHCLQPQPQP